jgi:hypothetical protein
MKNKLKWCSKLITVAVLALMTAVGARGQHHTVTNVTVIDGAKNPELIPDSVAYEQVLLDLSLSNNPSDLEKQKQTAQFVANMGLKPDEIINFNAVLTEFRSAHDAWIARWNAAATASDNAGLVFDPAPFLQQLEDLIQATRTSLKKNATVNLKVDGYVQKQKRNIQIHKGVAQ